jgi:ABC-type nitrate/sulfonate/bicarbonate transport system ATPase subunit
VAEVVLDGIRLSFPARGGRLPVLDGVSLDIRSGEFLAVLGPSGCGKTTLLKVLAGLLAPDSGRVLCGGAPVRGPSASRGLVFQEYSLFPWCTVGQNIGFGLRAGRVGRREVRRQVGEWIARIGLGGFEDFYPAQLSGGMRQRAALARTLITAPDLLLLDEPFAALDAVSRGVLQDLLHELLGRDGRRTTLLVTHDAAEAVFLADRVVVMSAAPSRPVAELAVPVARPRTHDQRYLPELVGAARRLEDLVRSMPGPAARTAAAGG